GPLRRSLAPAPPPRSAPFPYTTLFRSARPVAVGSGQRTGQLGPRHPPPLRPAPGPALFRPPVPAPDPGRRPAAGAALFPPHPQWREPAPHDPAHSLARGRPPLAGGGRAGA